MMQSLVAKIRLPAATLALCAFALAACGDGEDDQTPADAAAGTASDATGGDSVDAAAGGDDASSESGGTVAGSSDGTSRGEITTVTLDCEITDQIGVGDLDVECVYGGAGEPPDPGLLLTFTFDTDYRALSDGDTLEQGTDFEVFSLSFYADGGFGAGGNNAIAGDLTIALGERDETTPATLDGELTDGQSGPPGSTFSLQLTDVPAELP